MNDENEIKVKIIEASIDEINENGLKFTMDKLAKRLVMSKKTIYKYFENKEKILDEVVDYSFDQIQLSKKKVMRDFSLDTVERLHKILQAMPDRYENLNLVQLYQLKDKYPDIYSHVERRLESDWEMTIKLLNQGKKEGKIMDIHIPIFKTMMSATIEQFFKEDILVTNKISYKEALMEVVNILMNGIAVGSVK